MVPALEGNGNSYPQKYDDWRRKLGDTYNQSEQIENIQRNTTRNKLNNLRKDVEISLLNSNLDNIYSSIGSAKAQIRWNKLTIINSWRVEFEYNIKWKIRSYYTESVDSNPINKGIKNSVLSIYDWNNLIASITKYWDSLPMVMEYNMTQPQNPQQPNSRMPRRDRY